MSGQIRHLNLKSATLADGRIADISIVDGHISAINYRTVVGPAPSTEHSRSDDSTDIDLSGHVLLPSPVEPHAHLDKTLIGARVPNETGDLKGAIIAIHQAYESMTPDDVAARSITAIAEAVTHGFTALRTHVDCGEGMGPRNIVPLVEIREKLRGIIDIQVVAMSTDPSGDDSRNGRARLIASMEAGADLVGGCPVLEPDSVRTISELLAVARDFGRGMDLHMDETTDTSILQLRQLADAVIDTGFDLPVTASHCVSLGGQEPAVAQETARVVAEAGIGVVTLPQTNLYLQGRGTLTRKPRGLTAIEALTEAGVIVAGGSDNWRDPFNPMGRIDAFETASLLVSAGHLMPADAYLAVSKRARAVMSLPAVDIAVGSRADLVAIKAGSLVEAIAQGSEQRIVMKAGQIVAHTTVSSQLPAEFGGH